MMSDTKSNTNAAPARASQLSQKQREVLGLLLKGKGMKISGEQIIARRASPGPCVVSFAQQRLWLIQQLDPDSSAYNLPLALRLKGTLNYSALWQSLGEIVRRHEALRTRLEARDEQLLQVIIESGEVEVPICDGSELSEAEREQQGREIVNQHAQRPFDLERGPVWRACLVRLGPHDHLLLLCMHHIVSDAWSMAILVNEFSQLYDRYCQGRQVDLPELAIQYADYAVWQRQWLQGDVLDQQLAYWRQQLAAAPVLELPTDRPRPAVATHRGAAVGVRVSADLTDQLKQLSRREGVTMFMTLMAGLRVLLWRYSGQHDISIGTPIANRNRVETEGLIGFLANTLVMRKKMSVEATVSQMLSEEREVALGGYANQDVPYERVVEEMKPERSMSREAMFQVMMILQNAPTDDSTLSNLRINSVPIEVFAAKFDMTLSLVESEKHVYGLLQYASDLYDRERMQRMEKHLRTVLGEMASDSSRRLVDISLLSEQERQQVLVEWNETDTKFPAQLCAHDLFEAQAEQTPDRAALAVGEDQFTYGQVERRSNQLAHYLRRLGVGPGVRVGICLGRSLDMIVALLGVLKAGGAYIPLDPNYPRDRLCYMLEDGGARIVLTKQEHESASADSSAQRIYLDRDWGAIAQESTSKPDPITSSENLAYVIYTSGSTGRAKGVLVSHDNLVNSTFARFAYYKEPISAFLLLSSFSFDSSVAGIFWTLCQGGLLVIPEDGVHQDPVLLGALIERYRVSHLLCLPSLYSLMLEQVASQQLRSLRTAIVAGEECPADLVVCQGRLALQASLINEYGPTEGTVWVTVSDCANHKQIRAVPIGRPIANAQTYLLDSHLEPAPIGVPGELYVGGAGVVRGYLGRPDLTAERFIPDQFGGNTGARLYRTGDSARFRADAQIEFLGRTDRQVKLRGYRIELDEIESLLAQHEHVRQCAVSLRQDQPANFRLVAYFVPSATSALSADQLRTYLQNKLPAYMIPSAFVALSILPVTSNGKLDRKALPEPVYEDVGDEQQAASSAVEEIIAGIWAEVMKVGRVGVNENFFEKGGHSLLATQVVSRVREAMGVEVGLREMFEHPTVRGLAQVVEQERKGAGVRKEPAIVPVSRELKLPLSYAQQRLWFLQQLEPDSTAYNIPYAVRLRGKLSFVILEESLREIVGRHEMLRTRFVTREGSPVQVIDELENTEVLFCDLSNLAEDERERQARGIVEQEANRAFDLERGPVWRA